MRRHLGLLVLAAVHGMLWASPGRAQRNRSVGGPGPTGAGFFVQELPAGFRIQGINPPAWRVPGNSGSGPLPEGKIFRTPQSQRLVDRLQARKQAQISRSVSRRSKLLSNHPDPQTGASWDYLRKRRSRLEGAKYTPEGRIEPDPTLQPRSSSPGLRSARPAPEAEPVVPAALQERIDTVAQWHADRAERRKLQQEVMERIHARAKTRERERADRERHASRRYGLSGGMAPAP